MKALGIFVGLLLAALLIPGCAYFSIDNAFQRRDEFVKQAWAGLLTAYKNRSDTLPALVEITKGYAKQEETVLTKVTEARASAGKVALPADAKPEDLQRFAQLQKEISAGMGRLLAVAEAYPDLKSNTQFLNVQNKLTDIQNSIVANQRKYVREVTAYNINVRSAPSRWVASFNGYKQKPQLSFDDEVEIKKMPTINFGTKS